MLYQSLGKSALKVSKISFGCMSLGEDTRSNTALIHAAIESGINFFDTADLYQHGMNEQMLGSAVKTKRKDLVISSKAGNQWRADGSGWDWNPRKAYLLAAAEKSLARLQTDYIDLYLLHGGTLDDPIDESIEAFETLVQQGKIRYYGISSIRPAVIREYVKRSGIASVMMQYSLLDRRPEEECLSLLRDHSIGVLARGSLAKGLLAGKPATEYLGYKKEEVQKAADAVQKTSNKTRSLSQTAIQFACSNPAISSAVVGIRTEEQLKDVCNALNAPALSATELNLLQQAVPAHRYDIHR